MSSIDICLLIVNSFHKGEYTLKQSGYENNPDVYNEIVQVITSIKECQPNLEESDLKTEQIKAVYNFFESRETVNQPEKSQKTRDD